MISWLITSTLLSLTGMLLYLLVNRLLPAPIHKKILLYTILGLSLGLPFFIHSNPHHAGFQENPFHPATDAVGFVTSSTPETVQEYCHCVEPGQGEKIMFEASQAYDFLVEHSREFYILPGLVALFLLLRLVHQVWRLRRLSRVAGTEQIKLDGREIRILHAGQNLPAASFRLFGSYLIWHPSLDQLAEKERNAVIRHEISHLRQFNTWEELFLRLLQTAWLLNPAFYYLRAEFRKLSEFMADDAALETGISAREYALLLLKLKANPIPVGSQGFNGSLLKQRIARMAAPAQKRSPWVLPLLMLTILTLNGVNLYSESLIQEKMEELEMYEYLSHSYQSTGKTEFCKSCTYEKVFGKINIPAEGI